MNRASLSVSISDGDLRRWMEKTEKAGENLLTKQAKEIMTMNPKIANKDSLAAEAVSIMEKNSITCLIVANAQTEPEGVIHLHDLLKAVLFDNASSEYSVQSTKFKSIKNCFRAKLAKDAKRTLNSWF